VLNILSGTGTAIPASFDLAMTPSEILAIASPFFDGPCDLGVPANPTLSIANTGSVGPGTLLTFNSPALNSSVSMDNMFCQMMLGGQPMSIPLPLSQCIVPQGINGPVGIWITSDGQPLLNNVRDRATTQLVAGPTMAFIDTQPQSLGQLAHGGASTGSPSGSPSTGSTASTTDSVSTSVSTRTISPSEASSIIASASAATATATDSAASAQPSAGNGSSTPNPAANATPGQPNQFKGNSADGSVTVNGWTTDPAQ